LRRRLRDGGAGGSSKPRNTVRRHFHVRHEWRREKERDDGGENQERHESHCRDCSDPAKALAVVVPRDAGEEKRDHEWHDGHANRPDPQLTDRLDDR
jgi:hypothetical protein